MINRETFETIFKNLNGLCSWEVIRKDWDLVKSRLSFVVDNKQRVKFWQDKWCETTPLCASFLSLFALAVSKEE